MKTLIELIQERLEDPDYPTAIFIQSSTSTETGCADKMEFRSLKKPPGAQDLLAIAACLVAMVVSETDPHERKDAQAEAISVIKHQSDYQLQLLDKHPDILVEKLVAYRGE